MPTWLRPQLASERHRRLVRRRRGRVLGGVAAGLADHLGIDVLLLRLIFAVLVAAGGAGVLLYVGLWIFTPEEPVAGPADAVAGDVGSAGARASPGEPAIDVPQLAAFAAVAVGATVLVRLLGIGAGGWSVWPVVIAVVGGAVIWRQAGSDRRDWLVSAGLRRRPAGDAEARAPDRGATTGDWRRRQLWLARIVGGGALVIVGVAGFLAANHALHQAQHGLLAIVAVVFGLALVTGPWWLRTAGELAAERRERIRTQERAELAARLHDSVLQTLALIQRSADDPREVARLARSQERDLRSWLYRPPDDAPVDRLGSAIEQAAADVEDTYGVPIEVVVVGDTALDDRLGGLVSAAREAMLNAAKSSGAASVSVYAEIEDDRASVFVRDRGRGFDLASVGADRYGIRESIVGRMSRHGGTAEVRTAPGDGTEVRLSMGLRS